MTLALPFRIHGNTQQGPAEVEANTLAFRCGYRPEDTPGSQFSIGLPWQMQAADWGNTIIDAPIFLFRWMSDSFLFSLKKLWITVGTSTQGNAGLFRIQAFRATDFREMPPAFVTSTNLVQAVSLSGGHCRLRSGMQESILGRQAEGTLPTTVGGALNSTDFLLVPNGPTNLATNTGAANGIVGGTYTLDAQPFGSINFSFTGTTGKDAIAPSFLFDAWQSYPFVLHKYQGIVMRLTIPGTSASTTIYQGTLNMQWEERFNPLAYY